MHTCAIFLFFCLQCCRTFLCFSWSLVDMLTRVGLVITQKKIFSHFPFSLVQLNAWHEVILICKYPKINFRHYFTIYIIFNDKIATDAYIYAISAPWRHSLWKSFNCRYDPRMDYAFCLLTLKSSKKWWSPLFSATCNFNHQILPFGILFLTFINTNVFYLLSFKFAC
jgi:hypothetical protein